MDAIVVVTKMTQSMTSCQFSLTINVGLSPCPVTTRIIMFLVGDSYKPSFPLLLGQAKIYVQYITKAAAE